jgi:hypothetical protein
LPYHPSVLTARTIESIRGSNVTSFAWPTPLPNTLAYSADLGQTFVGDVVGHISRLSGQTLDLLPGQMLGSQVITIATGIHSGLYKGVAFAGTVGLFRTYFDGFGFCTSTSLALDVYSLIPVGDAFLVSGHTFAPDPREVVYLAHRKY